MAHLLFSPDIVVCASTKEMTVRAHSILLQSLQRHTSDNKPFSIALSGGSTPRLLYEKIRLENAEMLHNATALKFVMGDERLVPLDDDQSNSKMATETILQGIPTHRFITIDPTPGLATSANLDNGEVQARIVADAFENRLKHELPTEEILIDEKCVCIPKINIVLLGFGADGHTASIFPDSIASRERSKAASISFPSPTMNPQVWRVTLTTTVIQHADLVIVMCAGKDKNWVTRGVLDDTPSGSNPVARFLRECRGKVIFILDKAAAEGVTK